MILNIFIYFFLMFFPHYTLINFHMEENIYYKHISQPFREIIQKITKIKCQAKKTLSVICVAGR